MAMKKTGKGQVKDILEGKDLEQVKRRLAKRAKEMKKKRKEKQ